MEFVRKIRIKTAKHLKIFARFVLSVAFESILSLSFLDLFPDLIENSPPRKFNSSTWWSWWKISATKWIKPSDIQ